MFFQRRGCAMGCGVLLLLCVAFGALTWFVGIPRVRDAAEEGLSQALSTEIAQELEGRYPIEELRSGSTIRVPISTWDSALADANQGADGTFGVETRGGSILLTWEYQDQSWALEFVPSAAPDGTLQLDEEGDHNWLEGQVSSILSGGFETAFNEWLERNGLVLVDVSVDGEDLVLTVEGD